MRIAVTGGRSHRPSPAEMRAWSALWYGKGGAVLLHGDCSGVDEALSRWATAEGEKQQAFAPDWETTFGKSAGPRRNSEMVAAADMLVSFRGGKGTAHCVAAARRRGIPVYFIGEGGEVTSG